MGGKTSLLVALALSAGLAGAQQAPMSYDLRRPLCQQLQMGPELIAALTPPPLTALGLPAAVKPVLPAGAGADVAAVHFDTKPGPGTRPSIGGPLIGTPAPVNVTPTADDVLARLGKGWGPELDTSLAAMDPKVLAKMLNEAAAKPNSYQVTAPIASALVASGYDLLAPGALTSAAREAVIYRLGLVGDERVLPLGEAALAEWVKRDGVVVPVSAVASYYRRLSQFDKAAATWLRGLDLATNPGVKADYQVFAGLDFMRAGDAKRGAELVGEAARQGVAQGQARRLAGTVGSSVMQLGEQGSPDLAEALMAAAEPLRTSEAAPLWQCQRCYLLLLRDKTEAARQVCAAALADAEARLAAATADKRDVCASDLVAARDLSDWFTARDGKLVARPARIRLLPGAEMAYLTVVTRSKGTLVPTSSVPWLSCQAMSASVLYSTFVPLAQRGCKYGVMARLGADHPATGQGEVTLDWADGDLTAELKLPVQLGAGNQP